MAETYCRKTCTECVLKDTLNCPGCKMGPGRKIGGDCGISRCARNKSHETCDTCSVSGNCGMLQGRAHMPDDRLRRIKAEEEQKAAFARRAPVLGKGLSILFWLIIPSAIAGLMGNQLVLELAPALYRAGLVLNAAVQAVYGFVLVKLAAEEACYLWAGICFLIAGADHLLYTERNSITAVGAVFLQLRFFDICYPGDGIECVMQRRFLIIGRLAIHRYSRYNDNNTRYSIWFSIAEQLWIRISAIEKCANGGVG